MFSSAPLKLLLIAIVNMLLLYYYYMVGKLISRTHHRVLAVTALDKKALVWFDDVDISAFYSCVVVDLWQSLSEWHLLLSACVLVCRRKNVGS